jgi:hypothetical protein
MDTTEFDEELEYYKFQQEDEDHRFANFTTVLFSSPSLVCKRYVLWDLSSFNSNWEYVEEHLVKPTGFANVTVPCRQNRAVIFDSFLFHTTDNCRFRQGYGNRRNNLIILYGNRETIL